MRDPRSATSKLMRGRACPGTERQGGNVLAGEYPGRPSHIHYRVSMTGYRTLVTQLYFNPERGVDAARVAKLTRGAAVDGKQGDYQAVFDITLEKT